ncbi:MAG TPA: DUF4159 domain-containing protein [Stellaceae bacterium]|nr:DUF4159 domain-containing protein [Stellaceae bacterium]
MLTIGSFAFAAPWVLLGLVALPLLWWLLRVTPPAPRRIPFPAIRLLLGLVPREETPARTPLWLILLRMLLLVLVIVAFARPLIHPRARLAASGPIVLVVDDGWAAARDWRAREAELADVLAEAEREGRQIVLVTTAPPAGGQPAPPLAPMRAADARAAVHELQPKPWPVDRAAALARLEALSLPAARSAIWVSDGLAEETEGKEAGSGAKAAVALAKYLKSRGSLRYATAPAQSVPLLLGPQSAAGKDLGVVLLSLPAPAPRLLYLRASGADGRLLARREVPMPAGMRRVAATLAMPNELRNKAVRIDLEDARSAGAVVLLDDRWRRRPVGIVTPPRPAGQPLLSNTYYLERALSPFAEMRHGSLAELLGRPLAVLVYADSGPDSGAQAERVKNWIEKGGLLLRFAGPHLAQQEDRLLPVRLRRGGRTIGGAMSWERPARLAAFARTSPFAGLPIPEDVTVSRQVLAEPDIDLAGKIWARLADGTPLVTAARRGRGWIVLVHTTANADWSNLALSGLFVEMMRRIVAVSEGVSQPVGGRLRPIDTLDGFGRLGRAPPTARPISGKALAATRVSARHPPGFYGEGDARRALNLSAGVGRLAAIEDLPLGTVREGFATSHEVDLRPPLLTLAMLLALADLLIAYALRGLLWRRPARVAGAALFALLALAANARADDAFDKRATDKLHLAYVETGDARIDALSRAGLVGLSEILSQRTAVDPATPVGLDIERDELIFFPLIYWPVTAAEPRPSPQAAARINRYLETGGTILFDTRDGGERAFGNGAAAEAQLHRLVAGVKMPPLVPIPPDHVLTKSFYLLHEFPGEWDAGSLWVEPVSDHVNDGVSSVIVGPNDWAGAWAVDGGGHPMFPVVPGGEPQREMAFRFGVNLVMYVLTGNYKDDQVHVPAILERLGQ